MFRPSPPASLPLARRFILRCVSAPSQASDFTTTTASSADPLPLTVALLRRLDPVVAVTAVSAQTALHRVRSITFIAHPPLLPDWVTKRISGFGNSGYLALPTRPPFRFAPSLSGNFGYGFLQIPHWLAPTVCSLVGQRLASFFGHPCLHLHVASFQGP